MADLSGTMHAYLEKRDPKKNVSRFYALTVLPNLFGEWSLCREWGRIGQAGQVRISFFSSREQAQRQFDAIEASKKRRGYWLRPQQISMF